MTEKTRPGLTRRIDIFELLGQRPDELVGSLHGPGYSGGGAISTTVTLDEGTFADDFHVIALEWDPSRIAWYLDGENFAVQTYAQMGTRPWVFNHEFYLILNLAVGGNYGPARRDDGLSRRHGGGLYPRLCSLALGSHGSSRSARSWARSGPASPRPPLGTAPP